MKRALLAAGTALVLTLAGSRAAAHRPSDSTLALRPDATGGEGRWDIALRDLDDALELDADGDGALTWGELRARAADVVTYALGRLTLATPAGPCAVRAGALSIVAHSDGPYLALPLRLGCPAAATLSLDYRLLFDRDPSHRGLVHVEGAAVILSDRDHARTLGWEGAPAARSTLGFVREGLAHIAQGRDHLLFLLALLLPAVLRRERGGWAPAPALPQVLADVARVVTAFTLAHSLTLSLAALGLVRLPSALVEATIAASVALAAVNNLRPLFGRDRWVVAFALGLVHGFGFSSALADGGLPRGQLLPALFGFNVGVELGQLLLVALFVPLAYLARRHAGYRRFALVGGSAAIAAVALVWFVERALDLSLTGWGA